MRTNRCAVIFMRFVGARRGYHSAPNALEMFSRTLPRAIFLGSKTELSGGESRLERYS